MTIKESMEIIETKNLLKFYWGKSTDDKLTLEESIILDEVLEAKKELIGDDFYTYSFETDMEEGNWKKYAGLLSTSQIVGVLISRGGIYSIKKDDADKLLRKLKIEENIDKINLNVNCDSHFGTLLTGSCEFRSDEIILMLLEAGADPNKIDGIKYYPVRSYIDGHNPYYQCADRFKEVEAGLKVLYSFGAKMNIENDTKFIDKEDEYYKFLEKLYEKMNWF